MEKASDGSTLYAKEITIDPMPAPGTTNIAHDLNSCEDIHNLLPTESAGVVGVITGKALYSGSLDLKEAIAAALEVL